MKVLVIGSGGREHALVRGLRGDPDVSELHAAPGNAGMAADATVHQVDVLQSEAIADLATRLDVALVVIGPEAPLVHGAADAVRAQGIPCFGPSAQAARLEGSKAFAKDVMAAANVPTAMSVVCDTPQQVGDALDRFGAPYVVKDDGLAAGKGVVVTDDRDVAFAHATACGKVVIEEYLDGPEVSMFCVTDGRSVVPLPPAQDFKRAYDGDQGPNTGGMGAYSPLPWLPDGFVDDMLDRVVRPTVDEMRHRGIPFIGALYAGAAITARGVRVVEFNARFGDPDIQPVLARLRSGLGGLLLAAATGTLHQHPAPLWDKASAVSVVVAAQGYPEAPRKGDPVHGIDDAAAMPGVEVLHAGTRLDSSGTVVSGGGRVLTVTALADGIEAARTAVYSAVDRIRLDGSYARSDIALAAARGEVRVPAPHA
ncbi:phosphoribosylamine--glycine ligase [Actinobacteria bacterium YIM 96077]|uniref:Phosphoribosylamine--glycine ligase n=1 Tax=Phytoactinopolyspora halophila TaxID=1981511 RepID=A0A329R167_9ACTN|nr:phosphoribosylamine--glycine ligase [Phytoactinopolyspora halophila]AYY11396.1 phosphoribosylamine--glycine ligase [Actinobacteria bacterium YIM 96077]RAW18123.1 phosphoribosylamine--glycine ligase [Phytoactinopolyspora halophila]